jgi:hypothetical protein
VSRSSLLLRTCLAIGVAAVAIGCGDRLEPGAGLRRRRADVLATWAVCRGHPQTSTGWRRGAVTNAVSPVPVTRRPTPPCSPAHPDRHGSSNLEAAERRWGPGRAIGCQRADRQGSLCARPRPPLRARPVALRRRPAGSQRSVLVERSGEQTIATASRWRRSTRERFFSSSTSEPHEPYEPPEPFASLRGQPYLGEVAAADERRPAARHPARALSRPVDRGGGRRRPRRDARRARRGDPHLRRLPALRVPFLLRLPGVSRDQGQRLVGLVDVVPTLCALLGVPPPKAMASTSPPCSVGARLRQAPLYVESLTRRITARASCAACSTRGGVHPPAADCTTRRGPGRAVNLLTNEPPALRVGARTSRFRTASESGEPTAALDPAPCASSRPSAMPSARRRTRRRSRLTVPTPRT